MNEISELIKALASLLWPILGFVSIFLFRSEISNAIGRIKKGKFLGQEVELNDEIVKLQQTAAVASEEVALLPQSTNEKDEEKINSKTKLLAITHMSNVTGSITNFEQIKINLFKLHHCPAHLYESGRRFLWA